MIHCAKALSWEGAWAFKEVNNIIGGAGGGRGRGQREAAARRCRLKEFLLFS